MPTAPAIERRDAHRADEVMDDFRQLIPLVGMLHAVTHFTKDKPGHPVKLSGQPQLLEQAVNLVGLGGRVFQKQDSPLGGELPRRTDQRRHEGKAAPPAGRWLSRR